LTSLGFVREALPYREAAASSDPLATGVATTLARQYALIGLDAAAARAYERSTQSPGASWAREEPMLFSLMHAAPDRVPEALARSCASIPPAGATFCPDLVEAVRRPEAGPQILRGLLESLRATRPQNSY